MTTEEDVLATGERDDAARPHGRTGQGRWTAHGEAQRQALVQAAFDVIAEGGFERLRTREVAARVGVNIATLHYYFATKEDLIRAVAWHVQHHLATTHAPWLPDVGDLSPLEALRAELDDMRYQLERDPRIYAVLFELSWRGLRDSATRAVMREIDRGWQDYIESLLTEGVRRGDFRADLDIPTVAAAYIALIKGGVMQLMNEPARFPVERVRAEVERWVLAPAPTAEQ